MTPLKRSYGPEIHRVARVTFILETSGEV